MLKSSTDKSSGITDFDGINGIFLTGKHGGRKGIYRILQAWLLNRKFPWFALSRDSMTYLEASYSRSRSPGHAKKRRLPEPPWAVRDSSEKSESQ
jgi:hypothetical protein